MNVINKIKLLIVLGFLIQSTTISAHISEDYKQGIKDEEKSIFPVFPNTSENYPITVPCKTKPY